MAAVSQQTATREKPFAAAADGKASLIDKYIFEDLQANTLLLPARRPIRIHPPGHSRRPAASRSRPRESVRSGRERKQREARWMSFWQSRNGR